MANTYYDSQLTAEQIEQALEAIIGVIVQANNGKVLAINNGKLEARSVQWGGGSALEPLSVTANGDYYPEAGVDGFDEVHVSVPNSYTASDEGKVVSNGALVVQTARSSQITQNGTYDTTLNNEVTVNVSGGGSAVVQPLSVTQNGTYNPPSGVDGYAPVTVNVSGGGGEEWTTLTNYIEASGGQYIDTGYIVNQNSKIEVVADVPDAAYSYPALFGSRTNTSNEIVVYSEYGGGNIAMVWANGDSPFLNRYGRSHIGKKSLFSMEGNGNIRLKTIDGYGFRLKGEPGSSLSPLPVFAFVLNDSGTPNGVTYCPMKLYRMQIFENNTLVHEFLPWQENGVACLKDTMTGNIKYNIGTGDFIYGTDS